MSKLGATLKNKRESLGLDFDKITADTRMSADIVEVLEKGEYKTMPSYNHAKNFVKNYASYLKLDLDQIQNLFDEECTKEDFQREVKYVAAPVTKEKGSASPIGAKFVIPAVIVVFLVFAGIKVFTAMEKGKELKQAETSEVKKEINKEVDTPIAADEVKSVVEQVNKEEPPVAAPVLKSEKAKEEPKTAKPKAETKNEVKQETSDPAMSAFMPDVVDEPMAVAKTAVVSFVDVCWVHIKIDGKEEMDFIAEKGTSRNIVFHDDFVMDIGNAAVVTITYNDRTIAGLGAYKQPLKGLKFIVNDNDRLTYTSVK